MSWNNISVKSTVFSEPHGKSERREVLHLGLSQEENKSAFEELVHSDLLPAIRLRKWGLASQIIEKVLGRPVSETQVLDLSEGRVTHGFFPLRVSTGLDPLGHGCIYCLSGAPEKIDLHVGLSPASGRVCFPHSLCRLRVLRRWAWRRFSPLSLRFRFLRGPFCSSISFFI